MDSDSELIATVNGKPVKATRRGDRIARIAQPAARLVDAALGTDLQNCGGCKRTQDNLNNGMSLADAFYDRFWPTKKDDHGENNS